MPWRSVPGGHGGNGDWLGCHRNGVSRHEAWHTRGCRLDVGLLELLRSLHLLACVDQPARIAELAEANFPKSADSRLIVLRGHGDEVRRDLNSRGSCVGRSMAVAIWVGWSSNTILTSWHRGRDRSSTVLGVLGHFSSDWEKQVNIRDQVRQWGDVMTVKDKTNLRCNEKQLLDTTGKENKKFWPFYFLLSSWWEAGS